MTADTSGPAFPHPDYLAAGWAGMSLRDYFAAKAMAALNTESTCHDVLTSLDYVAETAYKMADAMLKARGA
jgi:hypothetical protein